MGFEIPQLELRTIYQPTTIKTFEMHDAQCQDPSVSILVPLHNAESYIIETVRSLLAERTISIEVIVIDDHSTDNSAELISSYDDPRIRLLKNDGKGISSTLNLGLVAARGSIIMRCDADDLYPLGRISAQVNWLTANTAFDAVCGSFTTIDQQGRFLRQMPTGDSECEITDELRSGISRTHLCTFAVRLDAVRRTGGFREYFETAEDLDFQFRLARHGRVTYLPKDWYSYRIHQSSITHVQPDSRREYFETLTRKLALQRRDLGIDDLDLGRAPPPPKPEHATPRKNRSQEHVQGLLLGRAWSEFHDHQGLRSLQTMARAIAADVGSLNTWRSALALIWKVVFWSYRLRR